jgi:hypothetical protein
VDIRDGQNFLYLNGTQISNKMPLVVLFNRQVVDCCLFADTLRGEIKVLNTRLFKDMGYNPILLDKCCELKQGVVEIFLVLDDAQTCFLKLEDKQLFVK